MWLHTFQYLRDLNLELHSICTSHGDPFNKILVTYSENFVVLHDLLHQLIIGSTSKILFIENKRRAYYLILCKPVKLHDFS